MTEFTTIEKLALNISPSYDAIVRYKGFVCLATMNYKGEYEAEIYEYVDEADEYAEIECRLSLNEKADVAFENSCMGAILTEGRMLNGELDETEIKKWLKSLDI